MNKRGATILVVDDEQEIVRALQRSLTAHGYSVLVARSGEEAVDITARRHPDLMLLDLLLPGMSGIEVCRRVRAESNVPIIVLSVKDAQFDKVEALDLGADDYVPKPFGIDELLARIRVALRHAAQPLSGAEPRFELGPLSVDLDQRRVEFEGHEVALTPTEYALLKVFIAHRGKILTRTQLIKEVWGDQAYSRAHSLHVQVTRLRQKIEPEPEHPLCWLLRISVLKKSANDGSTSSFSWQSIHQIGGVKTVYFLILERISEVASTRLFCYRI